MDFNTSQNIDIDLYNQKYIIIKAKQFDNLARYITFTCYNQGVLYPILSENISVFLRYKKPDEKGVLNTCEVTDDGKIVVEFTEQMLSCIGRCEGDIMIINSADITISTEGEIIGLDQNKVISTMIFYVDVISSPLNDTDVESTYEFQALEKSLEKVEQYFYIIKQLKEDIASIDVSTEEAKEYSETAKNSEINAKNSEDTALSYKNSAKTSMDNAKISEDNAKLSETNSKTSETNSKQSENIATSKANESLNSATAAKQSEDNASSSEENSLNYSNISKSYAIGNTGVRENEDKDNAKYYCEQSKISETNSKTSETNIHEEYLSVNQSLTTIQGIKSNIDEIKVAIDTSETNAKTSETNSKSSEDNAKISETNAKSSEDNIKNWENKASEYNTSTENYYKSTRSYAVGDIGYRENEEIDNAKYYYEKTKEISYGLSGALLPMGTITFEMLSVQPKESGYMYNISNDFVTDNTFKDGAGYKYFAGTNVFYTADGYWDCIAGTNALILTEIDNIKKDIQTISTNISNISKTLMWVEGLTDDEKEEENTEI